MYDENNNMEVNENQGLDNRPEGTAAPESEVNFVMRDSQTQSGQGEPQTSWQQGSQSEPQISWQQNGRNESQTSWQQSSQSEPQTSWQQSGRNESQTSWQQSSQNESQAFRQQQNYQWQQPGNSQSDYGRGAYRQPAAPAGKKPSMLKKTAGIVAAALLFGIISGGTMVGINMLADAAKTDEPAVVQPSEKVTLSEEEIARIEKDLAVDASNAQYMDVSAIVEQAMPSVVAINNTMLYESRSPWFGFGTQTYEVPSSGSGIIVGQNDTELLIVSNNHVVENTTELSVVFIDGTSVEGSVKGTDEQTDLAVVAVPLSDIPEDTMKKISIAELGSSDDMRVGQGVIAIGNALGYGQSVTVGYVSALDREVKTQDSTVRKLLQTDAAINPGNSGGALLNMKGQVIGINAAKYSDTEVEGMGYAIPISQAEEIINSLMVRRSGDKVEEGSEGYLGIQGVSVDESMVQQLGIPQGVYVYKILEGGAASKTDLREKDVITEFDGQAIRSMAGLQELLKYYKVGETVEMTVQSLEDGQYVERTVTITLGKQVSAD